MVMLPDIWGKAIDEITHSTVSATGEPAHLIVPTPSGETFTQRHAERLATEDHLIFACGRYEGIDSRVAEHYRAAGHKVSELSIGDYVLNGGEVAAMVMVEAVGRLLPGVVGNPESLVEESHGAAGLLEYPVYTKPAEWNGLAIPEVLLSGHHAKIARWRRDRALERTATRRPDMIEALDPGSLNKHDRNALWELGWAIEGGSVVRRSE
jgi:tRNA (guanine37-N1)-methyltransferase